MNSMTKLVTHLLFVGLLVVLPIQEARANCLRDFVKSPYSSKPVVKAGLAYTASALSIALLTWSAIRGWEYAAAMQGHQAALPPCNGHTCPYAELTARFTCADYNDGYFCKDKDILQCRDIVSQCVSYANLRAQGINQSLWSIVGNLGIISTNLCFYKRTYRAVRDYLLDKSEWKENRRKIEGLCGSTAEWEVLPPSLIALYEEVLPENPMLTIHDLYYNLVIYGNEQDQLCPYGTFLNAQQMKDWLKSLKPITTEDFLLVSEKVKLSEEYIEGESLFALMKPAAENIRDLVLARNKAIEELPLGDVEINKLESAILSKRREVALASGALSNAQTKEQVAKKTPKIDARESQELVELVELNDRIYQRADSELSELDRSYHESKALKAKNQKRLKLTEKDLEFAYLAFVQDLKRLLGSKELEERKNIFRHRLQNQDGGRTEAKESKIDVGLSSDEVAPILP